jgi:hypothetical protein
MCLYFSLLGALQNVGQALHHNHRTLKEAILNHMVENCSKAYYFVDTAGAYRDGDVYRTHETLQDALRAEPPIGYPMFNESFTTIERYRQVEW